MEKNNTKSDDPWKISRSPSENGELESSRILCIMAVFAFVSFGFVDSLIIEESIWPLIKVRAILVFIILTLLGFSYATAAQKYFQYIGGCVTVLTGFGVVLLTGYTGGAESFYWTMILLTFFTVALIFIWALPSTKTIQE